MLESRAAVEGESGPERVMENGEKTFECHAGLKKKNACGDGENHESPG